MSYSAPSPARHSGGACAGAANGPRSGPFAPFQASATRPVVGKLRDARMSFARVGMGHHHDRLAVAFEPQDAWYAIFQLSDAPPHQHWAGRRPVPAPVAPKACLQIDNLQDGCSAVLEGAFDSLNIIIPRAFLNELADDAGAAPVSDLTVPEAWRTPDPVLAGLQGLMLAAIHGDEPLGPLLIDHLAMTTATHLAERYGDLTRVLVRKGSLAPWQVRVAREMIAENLAKEVSLSEVAAECRLSLAHFSRAFKASVGDTPHGWLQTSRTVKAKALLAGSDTLADIAIACGYADQSHFSRMFKRSTGLSPGAWRRSR